ncbi:hypothetical protein WJX77_009995 [Trebouxia sp. C0004]
MKAAISTNPALLEHLFTPGAMGSKNGIAHLTDNKKSLLDAQEHLKPQTLLFCLGQSFQSFPGDMLLAAKTTP